MPIILFLLCPVFGDIDYFGTFVTRYEVETGSINGLEDRRRVRIILRTGLQKRFDPWQFNLLVRTGRHDRSGSQAVTISRFDDHSIGPRDLFFENLAWTYTHRRHNMVFGLHTFPFWANTDLFWDRDIPLLGSTYEYSGKFKVHVARVNEGTGQFIGLFTGTQLMHTAKMKHAEWRFVAAFTHYQADSPPENLRPMTQEDASHAHFSTHFNYSKTPKPLALSVDISKNIDQPAWLKGISLVYGTLSQSGDYRFTYRYAFVDEKGAIADFAQNGFSRFANTGFRGHELRAEINIKGSRLQMRLNKSTKIDESEQGTRIRTDWIFNW